MVSLYDTRTLQSVISGLDRPQMFLTEVFFPSIVNFDTDTIEFDKLDRALGLAPFCSPLVQGTPVRAKGYQTDTFTPAYMKLKNEVGLNRPLKRRHGERFGGDQSPNARRDQVLVEIVQEQYFKALRRKEWMASAALRTGSVIVEGEDYPRQSVDFGRDPAHTVTLTGAARWGEAGVSPLDDIQAWSDLVADSSGAAANVVVMHPTAWAYARRDPQIDKILDHRYVRPTQVELGPLSRGEGRWGTYVGSVGQFDFWTYTQPYDTPGGVRESFMPANTVIIAAPGEDAGVAGYQAHGAIKDPSAGYQPVEIYSKNWIEQDPAVEWVMSQSAPLMVPARPNASFCATVR
ncbi:MAG: major capsid protein [Pseudomonadota bacterium]